MTDPNTQPIGTVGWFDLTVPDAEGIRDFYRAVIGWQPQALGMGGYDDYVMMNADGTAVAGVCHARGVNADLPAVWLAYVMVEDVEASARRCTEGGGTLLTPIKGPADGSRYCVIRDPAGAVLALLQRAPASAGATTASATAAEG